MNPTRRGFLGTLFGGMAVALGFKAAEKVTTGYYTPVYLTSKPQETFTITSVFPPGGGFKVGDTITYRIAK